MNRLHTLPAELYGLVERTPATVLLECAGRGAAKGEPERDGGGWTRLFTTPIRECVANEWAEIPRLFAEIESAVAAGLFAAGFFTYECGGFFEPRTAIRWGRAGDGPAQPLAWFGIYNRAYPFDHRTGTLIDGDPPGLGEFRAGVPAGGAEAGEDSRAEAVLEAVLDLTEREYAERIAAVHEWIRAGDVYQLNFTLPFRVHAPASAAALYRRLSLRQPAPYGAFVHWQPNRRILSFSPELFFRLESTEGTRRMTTRPMKGTAPRGRTTREDRELAEWLRNDPKNRSENVMIVDLLRNDLGRLCSYGSVRAENMFATERYPTLWQMTSTVRGELRAEVGFSEIFRALFPCGSITGAPKVRAMELLAGLEEERRGVYTGAIGFFSQEQSIFNVAIRTLELNGEYGKMGVGSGIVIDSDAAGEFGECLLKAEFFTRPANGESERFSLVETLLWDGEYRLIELHLDRLEDSAGYFDYSCDRGAIKGALLGFADGFEDYAVRKVRLLLDWSGAVQIAAEVLPERREPARVRISSLRTDPRDRMLFHKTTHRRLYSEAYEAATRAGLDDVLFLNLRREVTEGAIHNLFAVKDGKWATPPVECGLLAGVMRRHVMETQADVEERVLSIEDLREADAVYLSNAVRGVRLAEIEWEDS